MGYVVTTRRRVDGAPLHWSFVSRLTREWASKDGGGIADVYALHDSYTGFNITVTFPAPYLAAGASYSKVTWGSAWPVYQGDTISFLGGACHCAWLDGSAVTSVTIGGGPTYTLGATSVGSPVTVDVYMWGGVAVGAGPAVSTSSLFCVTINNTSGMGNSYGIANIDNG